MRDAARARELAQPRSRDRLPHTAGHTTKPPFSREFGRFAGRPLSWHVGRERAARHGHGILRSLFVVIRHDGLDLLWWQVKSPDLQGASQDAGMNVVEVCGRAFVD